MSESPNYSVTVKGQDMTPQASLLGVLVKRLGGKVTVDEDELNAVEGVVFHSAKSDSTGKETITVEATVKAAQTPIERFS